MEGSYSRRQIQTRIYYSQQRVDARPFAKRDEKANRVSCSKEATPDGQPASQTTSACREAAADPDPVGPVANGVARTHGPRRYDALRQDFRIRTRQTRTELDD